MGLYKVTTRGTALLTYDAKADSKEEAEAKVELIINSPHALDLGGAWNEVILSVEEYTTELKWEIAPPTLGKEEE